MSELDAHYSSVVAAILDGELVPFLGAGINLCGRPQNTPWARGQYLPNGSELAAYLARQFRYPAIEKQDLMRASEYIAVMRGTRPLYRELHEVFNADYPPTAVHSFFAKLPSMLRAKNYTPHCPLIVTTNYDDVLERAFVAAGEPFDLVNYIAQGEHCGKFWHVPYQQAQRLILKPNEYLDLPVDERTVILKIHGAVDRASVDASNFVITEDHYIDYLTRTDITGLVPAKLVMKLKESSFLFLGYGLRDWNLRVILHRIWGEQKLTNQNYNSWAIQFKPEELDRRFWSKRDVEILDMNLEDYMGALTQQVNTLQPATAGS